MAKKTTASPEAVERVKEYAKCNLMFPSDSKVKADGFNHVGVNDEVHIIVIGKIKEISDSVEEWSPGKRMTIRMDRCKIKGPDKEMSIDDALEAALDKV